MIWFITVNFDKAVHAGCLGFTKQVSEFVKADDLDQARAAVREHFERKYGASLRENETHITGTSGRVADQQDVSRYAFPEHIIGLENNSGQ